MAFKKKTSLIIGWHDQVSLKDKTDFFVYLKFKCYDSIYYIPLFRDPITGEFVALLLKNIFDSITATRLNSFAENPSDLKYCLSIDQRLIVEDPFLLAKSYYRVPERVIDPNNVPRFNLFINFKQLVDAFCQLNSIITQEFIDTTANGPLA